MTKISKKPKLGYSPSQRARINRYAQLIVDNAGSAVGTLTGPSLSTAVRKKFKASGSKTKTTRRRKIGRAGIIKSGEGIDIRYRQA